MLLSVEVLNGNHMSAKLLHNNCEFIRDLTLSYVIYLLKYSMNLVALMISKESEMNINSHVEESSRLFIASDSQCKSRNCPGKMHRMAKNGTLVQKGLFLADTLKLSSFGNHF
jgi:hypothetical protein